MRHEGDLLILHCLIESISYIRQAFKSRSIHVLICCCLCFFSSESVSETLFVNVTDSVGLKFIHGGGIDKHVPAAVNGSGCAFSDYDSDGDLDIYLINTAEPFLDADDPQPSNLLFQNNGAGNFKDVTKFAQVGDTGWGMGCAFADYDNDGDQDLYVSNDQANVFYSNQGLGIFKRSSSRVGGVGDQRFGSSVAWVDYDKDGYLDLYVANYFDQSRMPIGLETFFPYDFLGQSNILYMNTRDGRFMDVTDSAGVGGGFHLTLGVAWADYDNDGDQDLYLANDTDQNILYRNNGDATFTNTNNADQRSHTGDIRGGMGITWGDYDNDEDLDLFVTNWLDENNVLYRNNGDGTFTDVSAQSKVFESGLGKTCWGTEFFDYDNDSDLDLYIVCGHIDPPSWEMPGGQEDIFLENNGDGTFTDISPIVGVTKLGKLLGRGLAVGDYDKDGDLDVLLSNCGQQAVLLRNEGGNDNHWLHLKLIGSTSNRDAIGARVKLTSNQQNQIREVISGSSYLSQSSLDLEFGLGQAEKVDLVEIRWPSGITQTLRDLAVNQHLVIKEERQ